MKGAWRQRLPWVVLAVVLSIVACARSDYRLRERARGDLEKMAQRLAVPSGAVGRLDLSWLALYPEVRSATVTAGTSDQVLGSYQSMDAGGQPALTLSSGGGGVRAELSASLPGWTACTTDLPLLIFSIVLLAMAIPTSPRAPTVTASGESGEGASLFSPPPAAGNLVLELDADMRIQRVSRGVERFGYTSTELVGTLMDNFVERFHPLHHDALLGVAHAGGGRLDSLVSSATVADVDGSLEKVVVTLSPPLGSDGPELRARYSRMQRLCQAICDNARDSVVILDRAATVVYANASFRKALAGKGGPGEVIEGLTDRLRPTSRLPFTDALQAAIDGAAGALEFALEPPATAVLEGAFHALTVAGEAQGASLAVGIFRDVSEARRLAEELETARQRAGHSQKIEALGRMAGGVAHDFNNLLTTIVFNLEAAKATLEPDSGAAPYLEEMELATDKACSVTRQLLLYSRKKPAEPRLVSCHDAIRDAGRLTQGIRGSVRLQTRLEAGEDKVLLDDGQLDQVLLNLLVNAKDALGKQGLIEISTENKTIVEETSGSQQMMVALTVKDNGPGIPKEIQSKIFEPYFTTKEVGKGTGLGLSTALAIIEKAGGQLLLISSPGGTTFQIVLPVAIAVPSVKAASPAPPSIPTTAEPAVLLVEDETSIRDLLQRLLEQRGYRVTSAATGSAAAEILTSKEVFDVLVTDLVLPGLSGPELAKVFHKTRPGSPVLYMSGFPGDTLDETEIGNNSRFLAKPFSHDQLLGTLRQLLGEPV